MKTYYKHHSNTQTNQLSQLIKLPFRLLLFILTLPLKLLPHRLMKKLNPTQRLFVNVMLGGIFLIFGVWIATSFLNPDQAKAAWFDTSWLYRQTVPITNSSSTISNAQIPITFDTVELIADGKMRSDCHDIRVTNQNGKTLPLWIQDCDSETTVIYISLKSLLSGGSNLYIYYGNQNASKNTEVRTGTTQYPGISCKTILDHNDGSTDKAYVIDPNAGDISDAFTAYCDMTTDNGGWTIVNSSNGTINQQGLVSNTEVSGNPFNDDSSNISQQKKQDASLVSSESLIKRSNGKWLKVSVPLFDGNLTTASQHPHNTNVTLTADDGTTVSTAVAGYSNYNINGGGDYGITTSVGFDHHSTNYYHLRSGCGSHYFYRYGTTYNVNTALGSWTQSVACSSNSTALGPWYAGMRGTITPILANVSISSPTNEEYSPGPVGYWSMDEGSGSIVHDKTAVGSNGTISGATWEPANKCKVGKCLYFDGTNDYVDFGNISPRASISGDLTISFWTKPTNITKGRQNPLGKAYGGEFDFTLETSGSLSYYHGSAGNDAAPYTSFGTNSNTLVNNTWAHVVLVRDTSTRTISYYVNGRRIKSQTYSTTYDPVASTRSFKFGYEYAGYFQGYLDEVMIFPTAKTQSEINALYSAGNAGVAAVKGISVSAGADDRSALNQGLVGYWKMDDNVSGNSQTITDASGNGNDGTSSYGANSTGMDCTTSGKFGMGCSLDGIDDRIDVSSNTPMTFSNNGTFTIATWIKPDDLSSAWRRGISGSETYLTSGYRFGIVNGGAPAFWTSQSGGTLSLTSSQILTINEWNQVVVTYDNQKAYIYVNGKLAGTATGTFVSGANGTQIGGFDASTEKFCGTMDEYRMYNRALSSSEVQQLYNFAPGPIAYYDFEEASGTVINDKSGNGHTASLTSSYTQGKYGKGLLTTNNGKGALLTTNLPFTNQSFTWNVWVKSNDKDGSQSRIMGTSFTSGGYCYVNFGNGNAGLECRDSDGNYASQSQSSKNIADNQWHYVTTIVDRANNKALIYIDGILIKSGSVSLTGTFGQSTDTSKLLFGYQSASSTLSLDGSLDEVRMYNYVRTQAQIIQDMNASHPLGGSPVGSQALYLKLDEGFGTIAHDSAPSPANGTLTCGGAGCVLPEWKQDGKFGKALYFNASDTANNPTITISSSTYTKLRTLSDVTISAWINPSSSYADTSQAILREGQGGDQEYSLYYNATNKTISFSWYDGAFKGVSAPNNLVPMNKWSYVAAVRSGTTVYFYVNGKQVGSSSVTAPTVNASQLSIGRTNNTGVPQDYSGYIDELKIYTAALSAENIRIDYNRGSSLSLGTLGISSDGTASTSAGTAYCVPGDTSSCAAPIGEWNFEEGSGLTSNDTSSNGRTGTLTNGARWTQGKVGKALLFDGSDDYVSLTNGADLSSGDWTMESWIYPTAYGASQWRQFIGAESQTFAFGVTSGSLAVTNVTVADCTVSSITPGLNTWSHVVATFVDSTNSLTYYVNGVKANTVTCNTTPTAGRLTKYIGRNLSYSSAFSGKIDQTKIYNYVRTPAQVAYDYNRGGPIAKWKMDECQGSVIHDASGNGLDGNITVGGSGAQTSVGACNTASTAWGNGAIGKFNSSLNLDGTDDYINVGQPSALSFTSSFSLSAWVNNTENNLGGIISKWYNTTGNRSYRLLSNNGSFDFYVSSDGTASSGCTTSGGLNTGTWQHIVAVYDADAGIASLYKNGKLLKTCSSFPNSIYSNTQNFNIGTSDAGTTGSNTYTGKIDDVQIFNYALTATQVQTINNQNSSVRYGPSQGTP